MSLFYYLFTFAINMCDRKFIKADVTAVFVKINPVFSDENKILIKRLFEISMRKDSLF